MSKEREAWLRSELPGLVAEGIIDEATAERLKARYPGVSEGDARKALLTVFAAIGASLIFLGVIVLMAFNWDAIPRAVRVACALVPLALAYAFAIWVHLKKADRAAWREPAALAAILGFTACAGLLSQIYHSGGAVQDLILLSSVFALPFIYVLRSNAGTLVYLGAITGWAALVQWDDGHALLYWPLFAAILPRLVLALRKDRYASGSAYLGWIASLSLFVGMGVSLEKTLPGLWIVAYAGLFACLRLVGILWFDEAPRRGSDPFGSAGFIGGYVLAFILTYNWPWEDVGWQYMRTDEGHQAIAGIADYVLSGGLVAAFGALAFLAVRKRRFSALPEAAVALAIVASYVLSASTGADEAALLIIHLLLNACLLGAGVFRVVHGYRAGSLGEINLGTLVLCVLICLRFIFVDCFFDDMIVRGLILIVLGGAFLAGNLVLSKKLGKGARA